MIFGTLFHLLRGVIETSLQICSFFTPRSRPDQRMASARFLFFKLFYGCVTAHKITHASFHEQGSRRNDINKRRNRSFYDGRKSTRSEKTLKRSLERAIKKGRVKERGDEAEMMESWRRWRGDVIMHSRLTHATAISISSEHDSAASVRNRSMMMSFCAK